MLPVLWLYILGQFVCNNLSERKSCRALPGFVSGKTPKLNEANGSMGMGVGAASQFRARREFGADYLQASLVAVSICGRGECEGVV